MIKEVLIVEGRADEARIRASKIDVDMIRTDGFNLHPHTLEQIKHAYERRGVIILTDPDSAGERIRSYLAERFPRAKHAFVPREEAIGNNDLGIEQASGEAIRKAAGRIYFCRFTGQRIERHGCGRRQKSRVRRCSGHRLRQRQTVSSPPESLRRDALRMGSRAGRSG